MRLNVDQHSGELGFRGRGWIVLYDGEREVVRKRWLLGEGDIAEFVRANRPPAKNR